MKIKLILISSVLCLVMFFMNQNAHAFKSEIQTNIMLGLGASYSSERTLKDVRPIGYNASIQLLWNIVPFFSVGIEYGYLNIYSFAADHGLDNLANYLFQDFSYIHALADFKFFKELLAIQIGLGTHIGIGIAPNNLFGTTLAIGSYIRITDMISVPLMARVYFLFPDILMVSTQFTAGIKIHVPFL